MRKVLIATHGYLADGIKSSVSILTGKESCVTCINAYVDERDYSGDLAAFIEGVGPEDEAVIFTDIYGGSVNQKVVSLKPEEKGIFVITGFNLSAVLGVVLSTEALTPAAVEEIVTASARQLMQMPKKKRVPPPPDEQAEEAFFA